MCLCMKKRERESESEREREREREIKKVSQRDDYREARCFSLGSVCTGQRERLANKSC